ncbi:LuxR C-terminal-related transcriptional regulator [Streptomyces sp. NPDC020490]|uniref:helix-turn-helix transcriptional regulator n=1 Tax=Streptomyces sp. NPDC020490 TaxID=3365078 RepID=UPI0037A533D2
MEANRIVSRWPLVGRNEELRRFAMAQADEHCRGFVIFGPQGVGKSRLAEECLARAVKNGMKHERVTASAAASAVPLGAIAHLIPSSVDFSDPAQGFAAVAASLAGPKRCRWTLLVDDLHLLDASSAVLLRHLIDAGVVWLIGTVREGEQTGEAVSALCKGDTVHRIDLGPFTEEDVERLLAAALGGPVGRRTVSNLHTIAGGNVLYLQELVLGALKSDLLTSQGLIWELTDGRLPASPQLTDLITTRIAAVDPVARPVLDLLALCAPLPLEDCRSISSLETLAGLETAGLIKVTTDRRRTSLALAHPLYGELLRARISASRKQELLLAQAERTKAWGARRRDDLLHIATWRLAATGTANSDLLMRAASIARHAHDYKRVVALLRALPTGTHTSRSLLLLGESLFEQGDPDTAEQVLLEAGALAETDDEKLDVGFARMMSLFWAAGRTDAALTVNATVKNQLTSPDHQRMLKIAEGAMRSICGQPVKALVLLDALDSDPLQAPNISIWLMGAMMKPAALALTGRADQAVLSAQASYTLHKKLNDQALLLPPIGHLVSLVLAQAEAGCLNEARETGRRAWSRLPEIHDPVSWIWMAYHQAHVEWLAGHPATARRWYAESAAQARTYRNHRGLRLALSGLAACAAIQGDVAAAQAYHEEALAYPPMGYRNGEEHIGEAWLYAAQGRLAEARAVLIAAAHDAGATGQLASEFLLLTDVARLGGSHEVINRLRELASTCEGKLAVARFEFVSALAAENPQRLLAAADNLEAVGADLLAAEAASTAARMWNRSARPRNATAATNRASRLLDRCEAARTPLVANLTAATPLTRREREVAQLAARGATSRSIAATLHLSVSTVDNHLQSAYIKLGVTARQELAPALSSYMVMVESFSPFPEP